jgi:hypothetical protein
MCGVVRGCRCVLRGEHRHHEEGVHAMPVQHTVKVTLCRLCAAAAERSAAAALLLYGSVNPIPGASSASHPRPALLSHSYA